MFVKEAGYKSGGYKLALKSIEEVNGSNAYVVEVTRPDGKKSTDYYDMKTSLKVREVSTGQGMDGKPTVQTTEMSDYKLFEGVMLAHTTTVSGVFPVPFKVSIVSLKANGGIDETVFKL
jgi:zinc protease